MKAETTNRRYPGRKNLYRKVGTPTGFVDKYGKKIKIGDHVQFDDEKYVDNDGNPVSVPGYDGIVLYDDRGMDGG